jgi:hypothetical protein
MPRLIKTFYGVETSRVADLYKADGAGYRVLVTGIRKPHEFATLGEAETSARAMVTEGSPRVGG